MRLEGKRALVTGSRGIGKAIVLAFAREGADVIINYVGKGDEAERTRAEAAKSGRRAAVIQADVSVPAKARELIDICGARTGRAGSSTSARSRKNCLSLTSRLIAWPKAGSN
jgi:NAD(P)-dependent dehydrogenase (short-subunit alcohol dehydrogenase family)